MEQKYIALFPGQGSQHVGMAKDLFENFKVAQEVFEEASDYSKLNIKKLCFDGPESDLTLTEFTQPCLLTASVAAWRSFISETGKKPELVAGHSLGEYSALVAAGALPLGPTALWVRERGAAMQKAVPAGEGTMAAILNLDDAQVNLLCKKATEAALETTPNSVVEAANFNAPGQIVIAGSTLAVQKAIELAKSDGTFKGARAIPLQVSAPFHSSLMKPARNHMAKIFSNAENIALIKPLQFAYIPNRTAKVTQDKEIILELLVEQVDNAVLWKQSMETAMSYSFENAIEFGPGKVLAGLGKRISQNFGKTLNCTNMSDSSGIKNFK